MFQQHSRSQLVTFVAFLLVSMPFHADWQKSIISPHLGLKKDWKTVGCSGTVGGETIHGGTTWHIPWSTDEPGRTCSGNWKIQSNGFRLYMPNRRSFEGADNAPTTSKYVTNIANHWNWAQLERHCGDECPSLCAWCGGFLASYCLLMLNHSSSFCFIACFWILYFLVFFFAASRCHRQ